MVKSIASATLIAITALAVYAPSAAAREGSSSKSVGHGIKCRTQAVTQPNGTVVVQQVCYKGV